MSLDNLSPKDNDDVLITELQLLHDKVGELLTKYPYTSTEDEEEWGEIYGMDFESIHLETTGEGHVCGINCHFGLLFRRLIEVILIIDQNDYTDIDLNHLLKIVDYFLGESENNFQTLLSYCIYLDDFIKKVETRHRR